MALFGGLMALGWAGVEAAGGHGSAPTWAAFLLMLAILIRCGTVPAHCWVTDWFEHTSFGIALLFVTPLAGVYAAVRLVLPVVPDWILYSVVVMSLFTAVYPAGMALIQHDSAVCASLPQPRFAGAGRAGAAYRAVDHRLALPLVFGDPLAGRVRAHAPRHGVPVRPALAWPSTRGSISTPLRWRSASCSRAWRASASPGRSDSSRPSCWSTAPWRSAPRWGSPWSRPRRSTASPWCGPIC